MGKDKKNILHICLSPSEGGLELYAVRLTDSFEKDGYESYCLCRPGSFVERKLKENNLKSITMTGKDYFSFKNIRHLKKLIKEHNFEVIFVHRLKDLWLTYWIKIKFPNVKVIGFTQMFVDYPKKGFFHKLVYGKIDQMITLTNIQKEHLLGMLPIPAEKYVVIPNGVDSEKFLPQDRKDPERLKTRKALGVEKENDILVGLIGRFDRQKGQLEFIEAIKNLKDKHPNVKYVLVGADTYGEEPLQKKILNEILVSNLNSHVQVRGFSNEVQKIMKALDVFIMPSYKETFGIVLVEAMACEKICISTNSGGPVEILDNGTYGLLIEPQSSKAIEDGITEIVRNLKKYEEKAKQARNRVQQKYRLKDIFTKIKELTY
ncbi:MAG: glycosyltransferase family 4 protein [Bdellovibrionota bacterium]